MVTVTLTGLLQVGWQLFQVFLGHVCLWPLCQMVQLQWKEHASFPSSLACRLVSLTTSLQSDWEPQPLMSRLYEEAGLEERV